MKKLLRFVLIAAQFLFFNQLYAQIPTALKAQLTTKPDRETLSRPEIPLSALTLNSLHNVFPTGTCLPGTYYAVFQLYYDAGDNQTATANWTTGLSIDLLNNGVPVWSSPKPLAISAQDQTFAMAVFHSVPIACGNAYQIKILTPSSTNAPPAANIYLKIQLLKEFEVFEPLRAMQINAAYNATTGKMSAGWNYTTTDPVKGVLEYELDYVFITTTEDPTNVIDTYQEAFAFKEPARITLALTSYNHHANLLTGKYWYRIRAIGYNAAYPDHRISGDWFYSTAVSVTNPQSANPLIWQQQTVFAEEGKYKKVITYYDGSYRQRQIITNLSTDNTVLVGESAYDFEGRKAIDVLPVPATDGKLTYKSNFNPFKSLDATVTSKTSAINPKRKKFNYDNATLTNSLIDTATTTVSAGRYYSYNNNFTSQFKNYIPTSNGFVYSQTEYLNDATGRVKRQSGVGKEFVMDRTDIPAPHTTRNFYGTPAPAEIIRLFGSNVGNANHYKKILTLDPNNQANITYMDQEDRVIATALAGDTTGNVSPLESYATAPTAQVTVDLSTRNVKGDNQSITTQKILNLKNPTTYNFAYNLKSISSEIDSAWCETCTYDLKITVTNPNGELFAFPSGIAGNQDASLQSYTRNNFTTANCADSTAMNVSFALTFSDPGDYTVVKKLVTREKSFDQVETVIKVNTEFQELINEIRNTYVIDTAKCEICTTCIDADSVITSGIEQIASLDCKNIYTRIVQELKSALPDPTQEPSQTAIEQHADWCRYQLCLKDKKSDEFDKQLARVGTWSAAISKGYPTSLLQTSPNNNPDPFFDNGLSGHTHLTEFINDYLEDMFLADVAEDTDEDGVEDSSTEYRGDISDITNPAENDYYINEFGVHDVNGAHILYYDLMNKLDSGLMSQAEYDARIDKQRWELFKSFYLEAKRKLKIELYQTGPPPCASAVAEQEIMEGLPTTPEEIEDFGDDPDNHMSIPVDSVELRTVIMNFEFSCAINISDNDSTAIAGHLTTYFNDNPKNIHRLILASDMGVHPSLNAIQGILAGYSGCNLNTFSSVDPMTCLRDTTVYYKNKFIIQVDNEEPCTACRSGSLFKLQQDSLIQLIKHEEKERLLVEIKKQKNQLLESIETDYRKAKAKKINSQKANRSAPPPSQAEYNALLALYNSTGGPNWLRKTGWSTAVPGPPVDVSGWEGILVHADGHIHSIGLAANNLNGSIPASIKDLQYLQTLDLASNELTGSFPITVTEIPNLQELFLRDNGFTGSIPSAIGDLEFLKILDLRWTPLSGTLPSSLGNCSNLEELWLNANENLSFPTGFPDFFWSFDKLRILYMPDVLIGDSIPAEISNLANLEVLQLDGAGLIGHIPSEIGECRKLRTLILGQNALVGSIPESIGQLKELVSFWVYINQLTGSIPTTWDSLKNLQSINLSSNQLTGGIPPNIGSWTKLNSFFATDNQLTGPIPASIQYNLELQDLIISGNQLSGSIPEGLQSPKLRRLYLSGNEFSGNIPSTIGALVNLEEFHISGNNFAGSIPTSINNLVKLRSFYAQLAGLSGNIPSMGNLQNLEYLHLEFNELSGSVPSSFGALTKLKNLVLLDNQLTGPIPLSIASISTLNPTDFALNKFTFTHLLPFISAYTGAGLQYYSQAEVGTVQTVPVRTGETLTLTATVDRSTSPPSKYKWFKDGVQLATNYTTTGHTYIKTGATMSDAGVYYYEIINDNAPSLTLRSRNITVVHNPYDTSYRSVTYCLEYDTLNTTLDRWKVVIDWNEIVERCLANAATEDSLLIEAVTNIIIDSVATEYYSQSNTKCLASATEKFNYQYGPREYHYTLYYYDQAGNLVQTVPPNGVYPLSQPEINQVLAGQTVYPNHTFRTQYKYTSLQQSVWQTTPDAGQSQFWYDNKGQLRLSQNAQQFKDAKYSYTKYDEQGRIIEVGELYTQTSLSTLLNEIETATFPIATSWYVLKDVTKTYYDFAAPGMSAIFPQKFLRSRVSWTEVLEKDATSPNVTYYSYDAHGNVTSLLQRTPGLPDKQTDYVYDLISGKVNYVFYQRNKPDQFIHKYEYDGDNRLIQVYTSTDAFLWDREAQYQYYQHGPLARVVLGQYTGVQGIDYYYTLQGWIKGVNMPLQDDPANDGVGSSRVGRDVFAYALGYNSNDYKPIDATKVISGKRDKIWERYKAAYPNPLGSGYYNGNIAWMQTDLEKIGQQKGTRAEGMQAMLYEYDQLQRITRSRSLTSYTTNVGFNAPTGAYNETFTYDPNGNLKTLDRKNELAATGDNFNYQYYPGTNKLRFLNPITNDTIYDGTIRSNGKLYGKIRITKNANLAVLSDVTIKAVDSIEFNTDFFANAVANNVKGFRAYVIGDDEGEFNYDAIGNLIWDQKQGVQIEWTPYGKVRKVTKVSSGDKIEFKYDASGNRIEKKMTIGKFKTVTTNYVRDASGNVMAIYDSRSADASAWTNLVGVTAGVLGITKTGSAGWNAGAFSAQPLPATADGFVEYMVNSSTQMVALGLSPTDNGQHYNTMKYALYQNGTQLQVYANNSLIYSSSSGYLLVDNVLRIERVGSDIFFKRDGSIITVVNNQPAEALYADVSLYNTNDYINPVLSFLEDQLKEQPIYGSSRLGMYRGGKTDAKRKLGTKNFELTNHLGNVLAVVTDKILLTPASASADVVTSSDYYAFGSEMPTRTYSNAEYRYGFNGKEQDKESAWGDDVYDYGFRIYNPRYGRWFSVDPLQDKYPNLSPYNAFENNPVYFNDPDGRDATFKIVGNTITVSTVIHIYGPGASDKKAEEIQKAIMNKWKGGTFKGEDGKTYNIKFDVKVQNHAENSIKEFKSDIKRGHNVAYIQDDPEKKHRSNVTNGYYGNWSSADPGADHEFGHFLGLADKYYDNATTTKDPNCVNDCEYNIVAVNYADVDPYDLMGANAELKSSKVTSTELSAIGNAILKKSKSTDLLHTKGLKLDKSKELPPPPPINIDPKQKLAGYGNIANNSVKK